MTTASLWGDFLVSPFEKPPVAILKEQATLLGQATTNIVTAKVAQDTETSAADEFIYDLFLVAPGLNNYHFLLLSISHDITLFPVEIQDHANEEGYTCQNEKQFISDLGKVLSSDRVHKVIASLLSQSMASSR